MKKLVPLALLASLTLAVAGCGNGAAGAKKHARSPPPPPPVPTMTASRASVAPTLTLAGIIAPYQNVAITASLSEPTLAVKRQRGRPRPGRRGARRPRYERPPGQPCGAAVAHEIRRRARRAVAVYGDARLRPESRCRSAGGRERDAGAADARPDSARIRPQASGFGKIANVGHRRPDASSW